MAFYLTVPTGNISLQKLTQFAETRLQILSEMLKANGDQVQMIGILQKSVANSDCLIEGTIKDKISHFILRVICCSNPELAKFFLSAETLLFEFRFSCMDQQELCKLFQSLDRHLRQGKDNPGFYSDCVSKTLLIFEQIKKPWIKWRRLIEKYLQGAVECFTVPFQSVLPLIATREVTLRKGFAMVPLSKLRTVVTWLFNKMLQSEIQTASKNFCTEDERITDLANLVKALYRRMFPLEEERITSLTSITYTDVDRLIPLMPPCMSHLHRTLRQNHRLQHHSRVQYTLFLKEAGLSVHDALVFWRQEYSQLPSNTDGCCHSWQKNEGRYTYNIRHLYGLEGARTNYRGHSCATLQENSHGIHDGGCPFSNFDRDHLTSLLCSEGISKCQEAILQLAGVGQYTHACQLFFRTKLAKETHIECLGSNGASFEKFECSDHNHEDRCVKGLLDMKENHQSTPCDTCGDYTKENHQSTPSTCDTCGDYTKRNHQAALSTCNTCENSTKGNHQAALSTCETFRNSTKENHQATLSTCNSCGDYTRGNHQSTLSTCNSCGSSTMGNQQAALCTCDIFGNYPKGNEASLSTCGTYGNNRLCEISKSAAYKTGQPPYKRLKTDSTVTFDEIVSRHQRVSSKTAQNDYSGNCTCQRGRNLKCVCNNDCSKAGPDGKENVVIEQDDKVYHVDENSLSTCDCINTKWKTVTSRQCYRPVGRAVTKTDRVNILMEDMSNQVFIRPIQYLESYQKLVAGLNSV